jgi:hypothetical protein
VTLLRRVRIERQVERATRAELEPRFDQLIVADLLAFLEA